MVFCFGDGLVVECVSSSVVAMIDFRTFIQNKTM